jgi:hypothetical protein
MSTDQWVRQQAWLGLLDTDRDALYLSAVANRLRWVHTGTSVFISVGATSAFATIVTGLPVMVGSTISLLVAGVAIWSMVCDHSRKSAVAAALAKECSKLALSWRQLWAELSSLSESEALRRVQDLESREIDITSSVPHELGIKRRLNKRCAEQVYRLVKHEYGAVG